MTPSSSFRPPVGDSAAAGTAAAGIGAAIEGVTVLSAEAIDMVGMLSGAHHPGAGAVVLFSGEVRDNNRGQAVSYLEYEAYAANQYIIDRIKHEVPIWKCEHYADGTREWGNNCNCHAGSGDVSKHVYEAE